MELTHTVRIAAPPDRVWAAVMDIPSAAHCLPGVTGVVQSGPDRFKGSLRVRIGPIQLLFDGDISVSARDDVARQASLRAEAKDMRIGGTVRATIDLAIAPTATECEVSIRSHVQIAGRIGEFGQPVIQRKADLMLRQFAECLARSASA